MADETFREEMVMANVIDIAAKLGIAVKGAYDLFGVERYLKERLGDAEEVQRIISIARKITQGLSSPRELEKLTRRHAGQFHDQIAPPHVQNAPFSRKTRIAQNRLPRSGGIYASWRDVKNISRGPKLKQQK